MDRCCYGAVIGENRLMKSKDANFQYWNWTPILGLDVAGVREVIATLGTNIIALCDLISGGQAIYYSPNGDNWSEVLAATEIFDITSVDYNWTLASTSDGWYSSLDAGASWNLICPAGVGVPVGKSVVWTLPNNLFTHTGTAIWMSDERGATGSWSQVCDLTAISGYLPTKFNSIDGWAGQIISTCGYALIQTLDLGVTWTPLNLSTVVRDWQYVFNTGLIWRQVVFWDVINKNNPATSRWLIGALLGNIHIIRTYVNRGTGTLSPAVDMALSERHRINVISSRAMGKNITNISMMISGDRRIDGELRHAVTVSSDGINFVDVLGGSTLSSALPSNDTIDQMLAHAGRMVTR